MSEAQIVIVILDGVGDTTHFGKGTPLQMIETPTLDMITLSGICGLCDPVSPGFPCGSDTAHLSLFGYTPFTYYNGRGAFEALGGGMEMEPGSIAFKSNFATLDGKIVADRRCDRNFEEEGPIFCEFLDGTVIPEFPEVKVNVAYATEHRCAVKIHADGLSDKISGTDPLFNHHDLLLSQPLDDTVEAKYTANIVNALSKEFTRKLTEYEGNKKRIAQGKHQANLILLRGPGMRLRVDTFQERHSLKPFLIAPTAIIAGLGISLGIPLIKVEGATGNLFSNFNVKAEAAARELEKGIYDMGIIHIKATDDASHDGDPEEKMKQIKKADIAIKLLLEKLNQIEIEKGSRFIISVLADHSTSSTWQDHSFEPIPICIAEVSKVARQMGLKFKSWENELFPSDNVSVYNEVDCVHGSLGRFCGLKLINLLKSLSGRK